MVVMRVAYEQVSYQRPDECVQGIRERVAHGWYITEIRGGQGGPFLVIFRMDDAGKALGSSRGGDAVLPDTDRHVATPESPR